MVGSLVILIGIILIGISVIALAVELEVPASAQARAAPRLLYTCPACHADVYTDQRTCPACGHELPVYQPSQP